MQMEFWLAAGSMKRWGGAVNSGGCGGAKRRRAGPVTGFDDNNPHTFIQDDFFAFATALKDGDPRGLNADEITRMLSLIPTLDFITQKRPATSTLQISSHRHLQSRQFLFAPSQGAVCLIRPCGHNHVLCCRRVEAS